MELRRSLLPLRFARAALHRADRSRRLSIHGRSDGRMLVLLRHSIGRARWGRHGAGLVHQPRNDNGAPFGSHGVRMNEQWRRSRVPALR